MTMTSAPAPVRSVTRFICGLSSTLIVRLCGTNRSMSSSLPLLEPLEAICHRCSPISFVRELRDEQREWLSVARDSERTRVLRFKTDVTDQLSSHLLCLLVVPAIDQARTPA